MSETGAIPSAAEMADRLAIQDVLYKHSRGVDRADAELLKSAYWPDAEVAYGGFNGPAHQFCEALPNGIRAYAATQHRVTNISIDLHADNAVVESYVTAYHYRSASEQDAADTEMTYIGRYIDHMQKRNNVWKMLFRRVVMDWNQNVDATAILTGPPFEGLARGARAPDDPLYAMQIKVFG
ncbi:MAG: nuclear transport factor 2 family protein [Pseudomonadota bacterium]